MRKEFIHPLTRAARVWLAEGPDGSDQRVLVIVTTMELDPKSDRFKKKLVERLSHAAKEHLAQSCDADAFIIMNPLRDWRTARAAYKKRTAGVGHGDRIVHA